MLSPRKANKRRTLVITPSMRRPVGVKRICSRCCLTRFLILPSGHCRHASIRTLEERSRRSVHVGRSQFSRCCHLIGDLSLHSRVERGPGDRRSHRNSALGLLFFSLPGMVLLLRGGGYCGWAAVVQ